MYVCVYIYIDCIHLKLALYNLNGGGGGGVGDDDDDDNSDVRGEYYVLNCKNLYTSGILCLCII